MTQGKWGLKYAVQLSDTRKPTVYEDPVQGRIPTVAEKGQPTRQADDRPLQAARPGRREPLGPCIRLIGEKCCE